MQTFEFRKSDHHRPSDRDINDGNKHRKTLRCRRYISCWGGGGLSNPMPDGSVDYFMGGYFAALSCCGFSHPLLVYFCTHKARRFKMDFKQSLLGLKDTLHSFMLKLCLSSVMVLFSEKRNSAPKIHSKSFSFLEMIKFVHLVVWRLFESCKMNCRWHFPTIA